MHSAPHIEGLWLNDVQHYLQGWQFRVKVGDQPALLKGQIVLIPLIIETVQ